MKIIENRNKLYGNNKRKMHYFVIVIEIFNYYFHFIEFFLSVYPAIGM